MSASLLNYRSSTRTNTFTHSFMHDSAESHHIFLHPAFLFASISSSEIHMDSHGLAEKHLTDSPENSWTHSNGHTYLAGSWGKGYLYRWNMFLFSYFCLYVTVSKGSHYRGKFWWHVTRSLASFAFWLLYQVRIQCGW